MPRFRFPGSRTWRFVYAALNDLNNTAASIKLTGQVHLESVFNEPDEGRGIPLHVLQGCRVPLRMFRVGKQVFV